MKVEKRHGGFTVLCIMCAGVMACLPSGAAADSTKPVSQWHPSSGRHDGVSSKGSSLGTIPAHHHAGLPPLSAPQPTAGADLPPSRAPEQAAPHFGFVAPTVGPSGGEGYPFIGSNPTVPLPTGMTDTATMLPLPDTGDGTGSKVVGFAASVRVQIAMIGIVVFFAIFFLWTS
ncbi:uncharacterized protein LOC133886472 [Phragmites australis]|uniref:uncharacterized protein LOC133886472 n=1 Tax=Phragmites australis TaxID=29695 RepID=UPI002D76C4E1|nr:uncharacterized protein LOC133886472 [Phragmites australis]